MSDILHASCATAYILLAGYVVVGGRPGRTDAFLALSCLVTALWAAAAAICGIAAPDGIAGALELGRSVAWYGLVLHLYYRALHAGTSVKAVGNSRLGQIFGGVGAITIVVVALSLVEAGSAAGDAHGATSFASIGLDARLGLAVCTILLIENLYRNASGDLRWHLVLPCIALGGLCVYDILLYGDAVLFRRLSPTLSEGRAVVTTMIVPLLAISVSRNRRRWGASLHVSRTLVFHTASLVVIGIFLLALAATGEVLRLLGSDREADWSVVIEVGLACGGVLAAGVFLTSGSARSSLRRLVVDNFFAERYDYRVEWLRCINTLSQPGSALALHTRVIRAVAQVVDSPAGLLFLREADGEVFRWAGSWNMPPVMEQINTGHILPALFRGGGWIVEASDDAVWLDGILNLWLAVPLSHAGRFTGFTLVSKPRAPFTLDAEVFDLLRTVGQEVASHVAEQQAAETILQTRQLREYGQRFAFVAHDIKNVASQLALLLSNAEHHISNPDFQRDMLGTVGGSVQKITSMLARLREPQEEPVIQHLALAERIRALLDGRISGQRARIRLFENGSEPDGELSPDGDVMARERVAGAAVVMAPSSFDAVLSHLLDNAFEASSSDAPVQVRLHQEGRRVMVDVIDRGTGMSPEFIRDRLFHPFTSSKSEGFGIGVFQARELARQAGGDLLVISKLGSGTTMRLALPAAAEMMGESAP